MTLRVAIQMDPLASINPAADSTLLLGQEAQRRGHGVWVYTPDKLSWREGKITAGAERVKLRAAAPYDVIESRLIDLKKIDVVLLRQDPPFDMAYLSTTYLLGQLHPKPLVVNNPHAVRDLPEKLFPLLLKEFMPPTLISADAEEIKAFHRAQKDIVLKPLYGHGGRSVFRLKPGDDNLGALLEVLLSHRREPWMAQRYLPEMKKGERRVIMIDGEIAAAAARIPPRGENRAAVFLGAHYEKAKLTPRQRDICAALSPLLKKHGLIFAGIDLIGDFLTEVNITSPGSLVPLNRLYGIHLERQFWDAVEAGI